MAIRFVPTAIAGAVVVEISPIADDRGSFARAFCEDQFAVAGLNTAWPEHNLSFNRRRGTLRGLHYQRPPHEEVKLVRCVAGAIFDVIVDLRRYSSTYGRVETCELSAANGRALYIPEGCAHGFQTLSDDSSVFYLMSTGYDARSATGVRYDDPALAISWPLPVACVSARDRALPASARAEGRPGGPAIADAAEA